MMMNLSIIIPIYNVEKYIEKCITSVYNQGFLEKEFEIIIIDDESPDNSLKLSKTIATKHTNIIIISQKNKGLGGARNTGVKNAKGKYLLFLDSDDYLLPDTIKSVLNIAIKKRLDIIEFGAQGVLPNGKTVYEISKSSGKNIFKGIHYYNSIKYMNSACNKLYRRGLLTTNNTYFLERIYIEDFEFNTRAFYYSNRVMGVKNIVAHYLQSPDSITRNVSSEKKKKMLQDLIQVLKLTHAFYRQNTEENKHLQNYFETRMSFINITIFYQMFKNKAPFRDIKKIKKQLKHQGVFQINRKVSDKAKDLFRLVLLNNFWLFNIIQFMQRQLK